MSNAPQQNLQMDAAERFGSNLKRYSDWLLGLGLLGLLATLLSPLPPLALDLLLATNLTGSILLLMVVLNAQRATDLSTFPTLLLFTTMFRLGLNVASTRLILTGGEAGQVITAFGEYVGGSDLAVGMVVFLILIIIQFVVITKGSGRVSEVAARFVLDAMPGKQMAIDADLNAGLIDSETARTRREEVAQEAEFYGAMDGASKFVRGDAIAGLIITALNLTGGIAIASMQGMELSKAAETFSKLTIGDGLVSQIPALFISTAAGILVTKETSATSVGPTLMRQVTGRPKATLIAAGAIFAVGLLPGMPKLPFMVLGTVLLVLWRSTRDLSPDAVREPSLAAAAAGGASGSDAAEAEEGRTKGDELEIGELLRVDRVCLEIGYRLISMVQGEKGGGVLDHVAQLRKRFATRHGVVLPPIRIKDNIELAPNAYRLVVGGEEVARGTVEPGDFLAMDPGTATGSVKGKETTDPTFGLPAWWIPARTRDEAELRGFTVIDPTSVLVTHISEVLRESLGDLLTRDDVKTLVENAKEISPAVVEELVPERMGYGEVQKVLRNLLREDVPVRNMPLILEVLADNATRTKDPETLTELVRQRMGRVLCDQHAGKDGTLYAVTLDPALEAQLAQAVGAAEGDGAPVSPAMLQAVLERVGKALGQASRGGRDAVLLVRSNVRRFLNELARTALPKVAV
ncbi:MAG: flagellar biosynthesis protein FlhA, partial [Planctomycetota bacterium]|nr:flagellar biosynthesis protein FlhA [Planctomycetota bacterium]